MRKLKKASMILLSVSVLSSSFISGQAALASEVARLTVLDVSNVLSLDFEDNVSDSSPHRNNGTIRGTNFSYV